MQKYAEDYLRRGCSIIPVPYGKKNPGYPGWNEDIFTLEDFVEIFNEGDINIGMRLGEPSDWLIDADLDVPEARILAPHFLLSTVISGRETIPDSHWWYRSTGAKTKRWKGLDGKTLLEIRSTGSQTLVEPSVHPDGDRYKWDLRNGTEPTEVSPEVLLEGCNRLATAVLIARHLPPEGGRHDFAMALAGYLQRPRRLDEETVRNIMLSAWRAADAGSTEAIRDIEGIVRDTARKIAEGEAVVGGPTLDEIVPGMTKQLAKWWGWGREISAPKPIVSPLKEPPSKPKLAEEAYYGLAGDIVRTIEPHSESDPAALLANVLVSFGNAVGRGSYIKVESDTHYLKLFVAIVGQSSKGRKGTSWGYQRRLMSLADPSWDDCIVGGLSSGEGLINAVRDPKEESDDEEKPFDPSWPCEIKRLMVVEPELAQALKVISRPGNTLSPVIRQAWDDSRLEILTKNNPIKASCSHISVIGHITKTELARNLTEVEMGNGFANRFLWFAVDRSQLLPFGGDLSDGDLQSLAERLIEAIEFGKVAGNITWGESARVIWSKVYGPLSEGKPGLFGAVVGRAEAQVIRLAAIYAVLDLSKTIEADHLLAALAVWEYAEDSARCIFGDSLGDPVADKIMAALKATPEGMTRTQIRDRLGRNQKGERIDHALNLLMSEGLARGEVGDGTGGRPEERWFAA